MVELEDETDAPVPEAGKRRVVQREYVAALEEYGA